MSSKDIHSLTSHCLRLRINYVIYRYMVTNPDGLKPCGHRLMPSHFLIIRNKARQWKCKDSEALRRMVEAFAL